MNEESTPPMVKEREGGIAVPHPSSCVDVAAAVITRSDGSFLLGERPEGKVYAGYWEFPGGKIEASETPLQGLARELHEELGIDLTTGYPWLTQVFTYPHATVRLHFFRVTAWRGEAHGRENQRLVWQRAEEPPLQPMLPANTPIFRALRLPAVYAITHAAELGEAPFLVRLEAALDKGLRLVQMREKSLRPEDAERFARLVVARCRHHAASVLINGDMKPVAFDLENALTHAHQAATLPTSICPICPGSVPYAASWEDPPCRLRMQRRSAVAPD